MCDKVAAVVFSKQNLKTTKKHKAAASNLAESGAAAAAARERQDLMCIIKWTNTRK